jgi:hypothetical protein
LVANGATLPDQKPLMGRVKKHRLRWKWFVAGKEIAVKKVKKYVKYVVRLDAEGRNAIHSTR